MFKRLGFSAVMFLGTMVAMAQDPHFSQFYANPLYLNPALTGSSIGPRYLLNYRNCHGNKMHSKCGNCEGMK